MFLRVTGQLAASQNNPKCPAFVLVDNHQRAAEQHCFPEHGDTAGQRNTPASDLPQNEDFHFGKSSQQKVSKLDDPAKHRRLHFVVGTIKVFIPIFP